MIQLQAAIEQQGLPARLLLQVHDELVLEVDPAAVDSVQELVVSTMENAIQLTVPLVVETGSGANWMDAK
jgi:DNA polymerase-1